MHTHAHTDTHRHTDLAEAGLADWFGEVLLAEVLVVHVEGAAGQALVLSLHIIVPQPVALIQ